MYTNQLIFGDYCVNLTDAIGSGAFGKVHGAKQISTDHPICVKIIKLTQENEKLLGRETQILSKLKEFDNPHLIKIYHIVKQNNKVYIFMERCKQTLSDYILNKKREKQLLSLLEITDIAKQIINGYRDLYSHNIIHRDLKPENVLIGNDNKIKICDFGFGKILNFDSQFIVQTIIGTPLYVSPQALMTGKYTSKTDVFSFGLLMYFLIFQDNYFDVHTYEQLYQKMQVLDKEYSIKQFKNQGCEQDIALLQYILSGCIKYHEKDRFHWDQLFEIFDQITICKPSSQTHKQQHLNSHSLERHLQSQDQQTTTNQKINQKPPLKQKSENGTIIRRFHHIQTVQKGIGRQNKSQENSDNQTKTCDNSPENLDLRCTQTPERTHIPSQNNYTTSDTKKYSNQKDKRTQINKFKISLQQNKYIPKSCKSESDSQLRQNFSQVDKKEEVNKKQQVDKIEQITKNNQQYKTLPDLNYDKQQLQNNYFKQQQSCQNNECKIIKKKDVISYKDYESNVNMLKIILKGYLAKAQLAENLSQCLGKLIQVLDHKVDLFRFLIINYQQSVLQNIQSFNDADKITQQYPLQNQLIQYIDPINYILNDSFKEMMVNVKTVLQKLTLKSQLASNQINEILMEKEKYDVEDVVQLIQTNAIKYNYESIVESYRNHYTKFLEYYQYDLRQFKSEDLLKFLGFSTKFILSESLYSIEKLKTINHQEIQSLSSNSQILEKFIKENCNKNLKL
ncbi:unnamed protein product (macronuclear) [Paramecium tetraurelia]|uniref:Protein kinase domain-containing protein n=1 Tax=Paramecium tetraurelia TaxID=5888 RepID=A0DBY4_PARTE|nr:uncharacterized protein GSPATT00015428001 [Paramecium tetraurelia]CAK80551.1 unnamed protein product [Paramecium tetraurelia]|eukprot:XP_001447948.1 hypothetical protein (macronuclear) [Paramecium tetraurelia strain d4-2]